MKKSVILFIFVIFISCSMQNTSVKTPEIKTIKQNEKFNLIDLGDNWCQTTVKIAIENISPEKARELALQKAYKRAIEHFSGIELKSQTTYLKAYNSNKLEVDNFSQLTNQASNGIITEKEIINESIETMGNVLYKAITVKLKVGQQTGETDPYFNISANLNKEYFMEGENLELQITASKNCYITILNIMSNETVATIFPNKYRQNNFLEANQIFKLPNENEKEFGLKFQLNLLPNKTEDIETIKIIATKGKINLEINSNFENAYENLLQKLISIPKNEMTEIDLTYMIHKNK